MRKISTAVLLLCSVPLAADTCLAPKNPVRVNTVCGHARDQAGEPVANLELQIVDNENVVRKAVTDAQGNFIFSESPKGNYELTAKSDAWHLFWPLQVTGSKPDKVCNKPVEVILSIKTCGASVSKKGYHPRF